MSISDERQPSWHISALSGSNRSTGLDAANPLRDCEERWRRCGTCYVITQPTTITYHDSPPASDVELFNNVLIGYGGSLTLQGARTVVATGTLTNFTPFDRTAQAKNVIEDTGLAGGFAAHVGRFVRITGGARTGTDWVVTKDLGAGRAEISTPGTTSTAGMGGFARVAPLAGDPYEIVTVPALPCGIFGFLPGSPQRPSSSFGRVVVTDLELDFGNKESGATTDLASGITSDFVRVLVARCKLDALSVRSNSLVLYQNYHFGYVMLYGGSSVQMRAGAHSSHLQTQHGAYAQLDYDELFQYGQITAARGSVIEIGTACVFDKAGAGAAVNPGATIMCTPLRDGVAALWGTGNTRGIEVQAGGDLRWWSGSGAKPTVNAGLGLGREIRLGDVDMLYANVPAVVGGAYMGLWP